MTTPDDTLDFKGWPQGIINRLSEFETPLDALRAATNVDILNTGKIRRRSGYTLVESGEWHSLWSDPTVGAMFAVKNGNLVTVNHNGAQATLLASIGTADVSYAAVAGRAYLTNGTVGGMVRNGAYDEWALPNPKTISVAAYNSPFDPVITSTSGLGAGEYQVCMTYTDALGRESGAGYAEIVALNGNQSIQVSNIPQNGTCSANLYVTGADGDMFYLAMTLPAGVTTCIIGDQTRGRQLETRWLQPLPAGQILASGAGRLFVGTNNVLRWSEPLRGGLYNPIQNYLSFPAQIDAIGVVGIGEQMSGVFVCSQQRTYFLSGSNPAEWKQRIALPAGAVHGTGTTVRAGLFGGDYQGNGMLFVSTEGGYCLGLPDGSVVPLTESKYVTPVADTGRLFMRRGPGLDQAIALLRGTTVNSLKFSDSVAEEVFRHGV